MTAFPRIRGVIVSPRLRTVNHSGRMSQRPQCTRSRRGFDLHPDYQSGRLAHPVIHILSGYECLAPDNLWLGIGRSGGLCGAYLVRQYINTFDGNSDALELGIDDWFPHPDGDDLVVAPIGLPAGKHNYISISPPDIHSPQPLRVKGRRWR